MLQEKKFSVYSKGLIRISIIFSIKKYYKNIIKKIKKIDFEFSSIFRYGDARLVLSQHF